MVYFVCKLFDNFQKCLSLKNLFKSLSIIVYIVMPHELLYFITVKYFILF